MHLSIDLLVLLTGLTTFDLCQQCTSAWMPPDSPRGKNDNHRRALFRNTVELAIAGIVLRPQSSRAGEIGAKITRAVTTSELGIAVRRSVVQGAQVMDRLDQQAERFSDRFQLGSERSQREQRPRPKDIPPPQPLDTGFATALLQATDRNFCRAAKTGPEQLKRLVLENTEKLRPSFVRAGMETSAIPNDDFLPPRSLSAEQFNFEAYVRYKSYLELLSTSRIDFAAFNRSFEEGTAKDIIAILLPEFKVSSNPLSGNEKKETLESVLCQVNQLLRMLVEKGLIAQVDPSAIDEEDLLDWSKNLADISWSIALDGDITLCSQLLLQEQGYRLYPNFANLLVKYTLRQGVASPEITVEDYYMDTDYNSDPEKFEVKEVLLNVVIEP